MNVSLVCLHARTHHKQRVDKLTHTVEIHCVQGPHRASTVEDLEEVKDVLKIALIIWILYVFFSFDQVPFLHYTVFWMGLCNSFWKLVIYITVNHNFRFQLRIFCLSLCCRTKGRLIPQHGDWYLWKGFSTLILRQFILKSCFLSNNYTM